MSHWRELTTHNVLLGTVKLKITNLHVSQVPADHLLSASVMSAPAALAISKITYPEVEVPIIRPEDYDKMEDT